VVVAQFLGDDVDVVDRLQERAPRQVEDAVDALLYGEALRVPHLVGVLGEVGVLAQDGAHRRQSLGQLPVRQGRRQRVQERPRRRAVAVGGRLVVALGAREEAAELRGRHEGLAQRDERRDGAAGVGGRDGAADLRQPAEHPVQVRELRHEAGGFGVEVPVVEEVLDRVGAQRDGRSVGQRRQQLAAEEPPPDRRFGAVDDPEDGRLRRPGAARGRRGGG